MKLECISCLETVHAEDAYELEGETYCKTCYDDVAVTCDECGDVGHIDDTHDLEGDTICGHCYDENAVTCDACGDEVHQENTCSDWYVELCTYCADYDHYRCYGCERFVHHGDVHWHDDEAYCEDCVPEELIRNYMYRTEPEFFGRGKLYLGVEIEAEDTTDLYDRDCVAESLASSTNGEIYFKEDGSLNDGFELVTHPCTLDYHMSELDWKSILNEWRVRGYRSHDAGTCGLHVHLSRHAFGDDYNEQDKNIMKLLYLVEKHWNKMVRFSRRTEEQLGQWARSYLSDYERHEAVEDTERLLHEAKIRGRYFAVNLENNYTVELRLFRGTLKYSTLAATLQFCVALHNVVMTHDITEVQAMTWNDLVARMLENTKYPELEEYMTSRGLYEREKQLSFAV